MEDSSCWWLLRDCSCCWLSCRIALFLFCCRRCSSLPYSGLNDAHKRNEKWIGSLLLLIVAVWSFSFRFVVDDVVPCHPVGWAPTPTSRKKREQDILSPQCWLEVNAVLSACETLDHQCEGRCRNVQVVLQKIGGWKMGIGRTARIEMARVAMAVMEMMLNPSRSMILIAITIMKIDNKQNQQLTPTTWQQFFTVRSESIIVKKYFMWQAVHNYKSAYMMVKCWRNTYLLRNNIMKFEEVQSMVTNINFPFTWNFQADKTQIKMAEMAVDQELIITLMLWIHSIREFLFWRYTLRNPNLTKIYCSFDSVIFVDTTIRFHN